jgi:hypothetical protein
MPLHYERGNCASLNVAIEIIYNHTIYSINTGMVSKYVSRDGSVGIATGYGLGDQEEREFESR